MQHVIPKSIKWAKWIIVSRLSIGLFASVFISYVLLENPSGAFFQGARNAVIENYSSSGHEESPYAVLGAMTVSFGVTFLFLILQYIFLKIRLRIALLIALAFEILFELAQGFPIITVLTLFLILNRKSSLYLAGRFDEIE